MMAVKRRIQETRTAERNIEKIKRNLAMEYMSQLDIDPSEKPQDMEYRRVLCDIRGDYGFSNLVDAQAKGWQIVPADRHPDRTFRDPLNRNYRDNCLLYKGTVLCEREKELGEIERKKYDKISYQQLTSAPGIEGFHDDPDVPTRILANEVKYGKEKSFY